MATKKETAWLIARVKKDEQQALAVLKALTPKQALEDYFLTSLKPKGYRKVSVSTNNMIVSRLGIKTVYVARKP